MYINDPLTANRGQTRTHTQLYAPEARLEEIVGTGLDVDVARVWFRGPTSRYCCAVECLDSVACIYLLTYGGRRVPDDKAELTMEYSTAFEPGV